ncbi:MAG: O-antigen ligase family protein [Phascolarctobacterium sp.]|nr:O-antigen ligase family protein [Phascolarctobacterium sp.]
MLLKSCAEKLDGYVYYLLLFTVAIIPLEQKFTAICVGITFVGALFAAFGDIHREKVLKGWEQVALYLLFIFAWVSLHFSKNVFISSYNFIYVVGQYVAIIFVLLRYGWQRPQPFPPDGKGTADAGWKATFNKLPRPLQLLSIFFLMSVPVSLVGLAQNFFCVAGEFVWVDPQEFPDLKVRVFSTLKNPNILGGYLVLVIAYAISFYGICSTKKARCVMLAVVFLAGICLLYTYSRENWLACLIMLLVFCLLFCHKAILPLAAASVVGMIIGGPSMLHRLVSILNGQDTSAALRIAYLRSTEWIIEEFPFGVGWYGYQFVYPAYNYYLVDTSVIIYHCHNLFLNILAELGWHGLFAFLLVWGIFIFNGIKLLRFGRQNWLRAMGRGYILAVISITISGLTDHVYFNSQMGILFWFFGILIMLCRKLNNYAV